MRGEGPTGWSVGGPNGAVPHVGAEYRRRGRALETACCAGDVRLSVRGYHHTCGVRHVLAQPSGVREGSALWAGAAQRCMTAYCCVLLVSLCTHAATAHPVLSERDAGRRLETVPIGCQRPNCRCGCSELLMQCGGQCCRVHDMRVPMSSPRQVVGYLPLGAGPKQQGHCIPCTGYTGRPPWAWSPRVAQGHGLQAGGGPGRESERGVPLHGVYRAHISGGSPPAWAQGLGAAPSEGEMLR